MQFYIDPVLVSIGPLAIRYYGLVYAIGLLILYFVLHKNKAKLSLSEKDVDSLLLYLGLGVIIGGRIGHFLFSEPSQLLNPLVLIQIWNGGMSFFGALIGMIIAGSLFFKNKNSFFQTADLTALVMSGILIFGRLANFINQELVGRVTDVAWCFYFKIPNTDPALFEAVCRHPYQLYAAFSHIILFIILFFVYKYAKQKGTTFISFLLGYSILRFITDFYRAEPFMYLGLTIWQYVCIVTIIITLIYLWRKNGSHNTSSAKGKKH